MGNIVQSTGIPESDISVNLVSTDRRRLSTSHGLRVEIIINVTEAVVAAIPTELPVEYSGEELLEKAAEEYQNMMNQNAEAMVLGIQGGLEERLDDIGLYSLTIDPESFEVSIKQSLSEILDGVVTIIIGVSAAVVALILIVVQWRFNCLKCGSGVVRDQESKNKNQSMVVSSHINAQTV